MRQLTLKLAQVCCNPAREHREEESGAMAYVSVLVYALHRSHMTSPSWWVGPLYRATRPLTLHTGAPLLIPSGLRAAGLWRLIWMLNPWGHLFRKALALAAWHARRGENSRRGENAFSEAALFWWRSSLFGVLCHSVWLCRFLLTLVIW